MCRNKDSSSNGLQQTNRVNANLYTEPMQTQHDTKYRKQQMPRRCRNTRVIL